MNSATRWPPDISAWNRPSSLHALGGVTRMFGRLLTRSEGFWVTLCGPAAGFALFVAAFAVDRWFYPAANIYTLIHDEMSPRLALGEL